MSQGSARASLPAGTSSSAQRGVLFGQLRRVAAPPARNPSNHRLGPDGRAHRDGAESSQLALSAALVFGPERVARAPVRCRRRPS